MQDLLESFKILKGFPIAENKIVASENTLSNIPFPYYLKASVPGHKIEQKAVWKCNNLKEAQDAFKLLSKKFPKNKIIAQQEVQGTEFIIGLKSDKTFGKVLMFGAGGIAVEAFKDTSFRVLPITKKEIGKMIKELKIYPVISKRKKLAWKKLIDAAEKASKLNVNELDLNPVIVNEKEAIIVDARVN